MYRDEFIRIVEETNPRHINPERLFHLICFRAVKGHRQELIEVLLSHPMKSGQPLWNLIKEVQEDLRRRGGWDLVTTLGAVTNCLHTSIARLRNEVKN